MRLTCISLLMTCSAAVYGATLNVGPGQQYATPCAAVAAAAPGDVILIDAAGHYNGNTCQWYTNNLTLRGINGRPHIDAAGKTYNGQGIWVIWGTNTVVENIEFSGASGPSANGSGIWLAAPGLTVRNCYFHNNQNGILTGNWHTGDILVEYSEFGFNGAGDGQSHNIYVGEVAKFTMQYCYSHDANQGQLVKTRAAENHILYNRLTSQNSPTSYEVDIPNGGLAYVIGNVIEQGRKDPNHILLEYMAEGATSFNSDWRLFIVNNTFVNDGPPGPFVWISPKDTLPAIIRNNIFSGPGDVTTQAAAWLDHNITGVDPQFVDPGTYNYHLQAGSPAIDAGMDAGTGAGLPLDPAYEYVAPACGETRSAVGTIDAGAYEYGWVGTPLACTSNPQPTTNPGPGPTTNPGPGPTTNPGPGPTTASGGLGLTALVLYSSNVPGGRHTTATVQLSGSANAGGVVVSLSSAHPSVASGPATILVPGGSAVSAPFLVTTGGVAAATPVLLTATYGGVSKTASMKVYPALAVSAVKATATGNAATITWTTNNPANTTVNYGLTSAYGLSAAVNNWAFTNAHSISLNGLARSTKYHFRVVSSDATGTIVRSSDFTFTTAAR